jgi:hypothetical protein
VRSADHRIAIQSRPTPIAFSPRSPSDISHATVYLLKVGRRAKRDFLAQQAAALKASEEGK